MFTMFGQMTLTVNLKFKNSTKIYIFFSRAQMFVFRPRNKCKKYAQNRTTFFSEFFFLLAKTANYQQTKPLRPCDVLISSHRKICFASSYEDKIKIFYSSINILHIATENASARHEIQDNIEMKVWKRWGCVNFLAKNACLEIRQP